MTANKFIIITSINPPTESVRQFSRLPGWQVIVVGDEKTPVDWRCDGVIYLSPADQAQLGFKILSLLPHNHYGRKMVGYLYAMRHGAEVIYDTDDDNAPLENWAWPEFAGSFEQSRADLGFVNIYKSFTEQEIWPRGLPLNRIKVDEAVIKPDETAVAPARVGVWQGLADADPDVDAIYRLTSDRPCYFDHRPPLVLAAGTVTPFNSQNTAFQKNVFPLLYLPSFVTFRFTDILRGLVAQPLMWSEGYRLGFVEATVIQKRNPHNYMRDFESEIPCYLLAEKAVELVSKVATPGLDLSTGLKAAYAELLANGIVTEKEIALLDCWLADCAV